MKLNNIKIVVIGIIILLVLLLCTNVDAAGIGMSINKSSATVGDTFTVTISGINGRVNISGSSNVSLSTSGVTWVEGSMTITGTAKSEGTGTITVKPENASTTSAEPEKVTATASKSITINKKEEPKQETQTTPTPEPTTTTTTKKTETKKTDTTKVVDTPKKEEIYINSITIEGIKENGEKIEVELSPEFQKDVYEYTCKVSSDIKTINVLKDAGDYTSNILVNGLEELKEGENEITLQLSVEDQEAKIYTIKVIKDKKEEVVDTEKTIGAIANVNKEVKKDGELYVCIPLWSFILYTIAILSIGIIIVKLIQWKKEGIFNK